MPVATVTINQPDAVLEKDEVIVKDWSENSGMLDAMRDIVEFTGRTVRCGHSRGKVCKIINYEEI